MKTTGSNEGEERVCLDAKGKTHPPRACVLVCQQVCVSVCVCVSVWLCVCMFVSDMSTFVCIGTCHHVCQ